MNDGTKTYEFSGLGVKYSNPTKRVRINQQYQIKRSQNTMRHFWKRYKQK